MLDAIIKEIRARNQRHEALSDHLSSTKQSVRLVHPNGDYAFAGPDMSRPGGFRLTQFDEHGPRSHTEHATLKDAILYGLKSHFEPG